ncbi:MAG TPA: hypothetical protein VK112_05000, partial [Fodinibius sp.]|nr:hypothetical protein [Fodinibius sp.]
MTKKYLLPLTIVLILFLGNSLSYAQESFIQKLENEAIVDRKVMVPMRDGVRLSTNIYRPKTD